MSLNRNILINKITERMVTREDDITCSSGAQTKTYLDIPGVLADGPTLRLAAQVMLEKLMGTLHQSTVIAGPTMGAIPLVMGVAMAVTWNEGIKWSIVRDKIKDHGLQKLFVGADLGPGDKVILTDDVVNSGRSLLETAALIKGSGAEIIAVVPLVDRSGVAAKYFEALNIPYLPVLTYKDLGLPPLGA
jgi:orotate phosphoribosyltransferase